MSTLNKSLFLSAALCVAYGCGNDAKLGPVDSMDPDPVEPGGELGGDAGSSSMDPDTMENPGESSPDGGTIGEDGGIEPAFAWYTCQGSDQTFVRNAILGVLGRRPHSQAEVNVYTDLIKQVDLADGATVEGRDTKPGAELTNSRKVMLNALFATAEYKKYWGDLYRDFIRVQRVDEQFNKDCFEKPAAENAISAAKYVRDVSPSMPPANSKTEFSMYDVIEGSIALDDVTPIYTANLFAMLSLTYAGANAEPASLELTRRADFGAWFDEVYLHRDTVCLNCHNSEFSVTQTDDPATNRHFPVSAFLEKSLFGASTGPATFGGFEGGDRAHAPLKYKHFVNDCNPTGITQATAIEKKYVFKACATTSELLHRCGNGETICDTVFKSRLARPWGWTAACGLYAPPEAVESDIAGVEAKFGNLTGLRTSAWGLADSLRTGFDKLAAEGLTPAADKSVEDPDKAFAYLTAMTIAEKVWIQIVGTPLTIPTRFPRNAASRDQLETITNAFVSSGFSNQALLEAIYASPYINIASPKSGCGDAYSMPALFDPWVIAEDDPVKRKNSPADAIVSMTSRTATNALYSALEWTPIAQASFPDTFNLSGKDPLVPVVDAERQFQSEVGFYLKNSEPGFRGFDFQARLGWENRFGTCAKLPGATAPDYIDKLASAANTPDRGTVRDLVVTLKDRLLGRATINETTERPALEALLGASLDADANSLPDPAASLRKVCGVLVSSPQFLLIGLTPKDATSVPKLTPVSTGYSAVCAKVAAALPAAYQVTCSVDGALSLNGLALTSR